MPRNSPMRWLTCISTPAFPGFTLRPPRAVAETVRPRSHHGGGQPEGRSVDDEVEKRSEGCRRTACSERRRLTIIKWSPRGRGEVRVGDLGSGSDYTPFIQHLGVPSTDVGSTGPYGVYHSVFDNYAWFVMNADPTFVYEQQMARVFGLEALHMADTDVLPYDYVTYATADPGLPVRRQGARQGCRPGEPRL